MLDKMSNKELIKLTNYNVNEKIEQNKQWENFLYFYKNNCDLELLYQKDSFKFIFEMQTEKLDKMWGNEEKEKLENLKKFIGKKRK